MQLTRNQKITLSMGGVTALAIGDIAAPIIEIDDIAHVVVAVLTEDGHMGERYEVTGPRLMTFAETAEVLTETLGRTIQHLPIIYEDLHANVTASGDTFVVDVFTAIARETLDERNAYKAYGVERALDGALWPIATYERPGTIAVVRISSSTVFCSFHAPSLGCLSCKSLRSS